MQQQSDQKIRPMEIVREKTDKLKSSLDNFRLMFKGYNKMRSCMLPKGVSMLMANNNQDEEDEGPFKRGAFKKEGLSRRLSCPEEDVFNEIENWLQDENEEFTSLPPMTLNYEQVCDENDSNEEQMKKKETNQGRSNSLFEFLGKKEKVFEHRHSLPVTVDDAAALKVKSKSFKFTPNGEKRHTKRLPKRTFTSSDTGAILPSVLLTYQPSACNGLNEYDYYLQTNQMMAIKT